MAFGGGGSSDNAFLIGPFLEWWDKFTAKRDAKRTTRREAKAAERKGHDGPKPEADRH